MDFISLEQANEYFANRLRSDAWTAATETAKTQALAQATLLIGGAFVFGFSAYETTPDGATVWHERVRAAVCEEALWLLERDPSDIPTALFQGLASASASGASATFDKKFVIPWVCPVARTLVGELGTLVDSEDNSYVRTTLLKL